jgi:hypothetical protein
MIEIDKKSLLYSLMKKRGARKKEIKEVFNSINPTNMELSEIEIRYTEKYIRGFCNKKIE